MNIWRVPYPKFGDGPGLERVSALAELLGIDLAAFGAQGAVIVGSNGKGSTAAMCASILAQTGARVGLFTSPHLLRLNERFRIDGEDIGDQELGDLWARVRSAVQAARLGEKLGGFEFLFLIAALWFQERRCLHTVWEAGIGGRLDPVRLVGAKRVALTALDLEHTALLGDTLEAIACEKAEAAPAGARLYTAPVSDAVDRALHMHCKARDVRIVRVGSGFFSAPLAGSHQMANAALAVALARDIAPMDDAVIEAGLAATRWLGRLERVESEPDAVIDVGHTPRGVAAALEGFEAIRKARPAVLVLGVSHDKDASAIVSALAPGFTVIVCAAPHHKGAPAVDIARLARVANPRAEIVTADNVLDARQIARARAAALGGIVYVAGGLFLAAEYKAAAAGLTPAALNFF